MDSRRSSQIGRSIYGLSQRLTEAHGRALPVKPYISTNVLNQAFSEFA
ncbi:hypothetical protein [Sedimentisphaera salicampi]|nr:hypothetical protein [Sedimentisphaera salicampi]